MALLNQCMKFENFFDQKYSFEVGIIKIKNGYKKNHS